MPKVIWKLISLGLLLWVLPGCWVRLPVVKADGVEGRGGEIRVLERDIEIIRYPASHAFAREIKGGGRSAGSNSEILKAGTRIRVGKVVKRILEPGVVYSYECEVEGRRGKFDLRFGMRDSIGLPKYSLWTSNGREE